MILVAGLTPAWQQTYRFTSLKLGEVNRAEEATACASGKVLNVGFAIQTLGGQCTVLSPCGGGSGGLLRHDCQSAKLPVEWVETTASTRVCTTILDEASGRTTELVENAGPLTPTELNDYAVEFRRWAKEASLIVISGSLTSGAPANFWADCLKEIRVPTILDLRGPELLACLASRPLIVKPNREELERTAGRPLLTDQDVREAMQSLFDQGAKWIVVTDGTRPIVALGPEGFLEVPTIRTETRNPIGCGDSLTAGLAVGIAGRKSLNAALGLGIAAAAANAETWLPARFEQARAKELADTIGS